MGVGFAGQMAETMAETTTEELSGFTLYLKKEGVFTEHAAAINAAQNRIVVDGVEYGLNQETPVNGCFAVMHGFVCNKGKVLCVMDTSPRGYGSLWLRRDVGGGLS